MKKAIIILLTLLLITGCSSNPSDTVKTTDAETKETVITTEAATSKAETTTAETTTTEPETTTVEETEAGVDDLFIADFVKALHARWECSDAIGNFEPGSKSHQDAYLALVHAEKDILNPYGDAHFNDAELADICQRYLTGLQNQEDCLSIMLTDYNSYYSAWLNYQGDRAVVFREMVDKYGITVDSKYSGAYYVMYNKGFTHAHHEEVYAMLNAEFYNGNYTSGEHSFTSPATNTTSNTFENFAVYLYLYDRNGNYLEYSTCVIEKWEPGQTIDLSFEFSTSFSSVGTLEISED